MLSSSATLMWGVVFLSVFMVIAIAAAVLDILKRSIPVWLDIAGVIASLCVAAYTGALLVVCQTYPPWNNALLPILFLISAMSAGAASIASLISGEWAILFWVGLVGVGLILPTALETWLLFFSAKEFEESRKAHWINFVSDVGVLAGGFILRYLIVMAAVPLTVAVPLL